MENSFASRTSQHGKIFFNADLASCLSAVVGTLQGFDALVNLVLDDTVEYLRGRATLNCSSLLTALHLLDLLPPSVDSRHNVNDHRSDGSVSDYG